MNKKLDSNQNSVQNSKDNNAGRFQVGVGAFIELNRTGRILLLEKQKTSLHSGGWEIVYGRLKQGEDAIHALRREVAEETGIQDVANLDVLSTWHSYRGPQQAENELIGISFWCQTAQEEIVISLEHTGFRWIEIGQAERLIKHPGMLEDFRTFVAYRTEQLELRQQQDKAIRAMADYQNVLRRQREERLKISAAANADLLETILEPIDHLQLAAAQLNDAGLNMVIKQLLESLQVQGLEVINPLGSEFSVETMEAVDKQGDGQTIKAVVSNGYRYNGQVLRHAKVVVG